MKNFLSIFGAIALAVALLTPSRSAGQAVKEGYVSTNDATTGTNAIIFPAAPDKIIRLVSLSYNGDTNTSWISYLAGTDRLYTIQSNAAGTVVNMVINAGHRVVAGDFVVIQRTNDICTLQVVASTNGTTNILFVNTLGTAIVSNDVAYVMSTMSNYVGVATVRLAGEAIFVSQRRRPLAVKVTTSNVTGATNQLFGTAHYDPSN